MLFWQKKSQLFFLSILLLAAFFVVEIKKVEAAFDPAVTYSKTSNGQLSADEWNNLQNDFVRAWGSTTAVGGIGIGVAPQGTDLNGLVASSTIKTNTSFLGSLSAAYITPGAFNSIAGTGGNFSFPAALGVGVTPVNAGLHLSGSDTYSAMFRLVNSGASGGQYFMGVTNSAWTAGGDKLVFGAGIPSSANIKMVLAANGNVGIGTTNPTVKLEIVGDFVTRNSNPTFYSSGNTNRRITYNLLNGDLARYYYYDQVAGTYHDMQIGSTNGLTIKGSGNVGIGTTAPAEKLHVVGNIDMTGTDRKIYMGGSGGTTFGLVYNQAYPNYGLFYYREGSPDFVTISPNGGGTTSPVAFFGGNGFVGIGTTSPTAKLSVSGGNIFINDAAITSATPNAAITKSYLDASLSSTTASIVTQIATSSLWQGSLTGAIYSNNSGNVGIGTSTPTEKLEVVGKLKIGNNTISGENITFDGVTGGGMRVTNQYGYVNITPINTGWVHFYTDRGAFIFNKPVYNIGGGGFSSYTNENLLLKTGGTTRITVNYANGNVGIGTTTPGSLLTVGSNLGLTTLGTIYGPDTTPSRHLDFSGTLTDSLSVPGDLHSTAGLLKIDGTGNSYVLGKLGVKTSSPKGNLSVDVGSSSGMGINGLVVEESGATVAALGDGSASGAQNGYLGLYSTGEVERVRLYAYGNNWISPSNGNVGIGTTNPTEKLEITGNIKFSDGAQRNIIGGLNQSLGIYSRPNSMGEGIIFSTDGGTTNEMFIQDGGNVGINTASPIYKLDVAGEANFNGNQVHGVSAPTQGTDAANKNYVDSSITPPATTTAGIQAGFWTTGAGGSIYNNNSSGLVGIGTTAPGNKLSVLGSSFTLFDNTRGIKFRVDGSGLNGNRAYVLLDPNASSEANIGVGSDYGYVAQDGADFLFYNNASGNMHFRTGTDNRLTILNNGNVGINTTAPIQKFHVAGDASFAVGTSSPSQVHDVAAPTLGTDVANRNYVDTNFAPIAIVGSASLWATSSAGTYNVGLGNVGIGVTNPAYKLQVNGTLAVKDPIGANSTRAIIYADENGAYYTMDGGSAKPIIFKTWTGGTETLRINTNGNIGIGATNPTNLLSLYKDSDAITRISIDNPNNGTNAGTNLVFQKNGVNMAGNYFSNYDNSYKISTYLASDIFFSTTNIERMRIAAGGNIGIGNTAPAYKLDVAGEGNFMIGTSSPSQIHGVAAPVQGTDAANRNYVDTLINDSVSAAEYWKLSGSNLYASSTNWNVGIGTTAPNEQLEITKNFRLPATSGTTPYGIIYKNGSPFIHDFNYGLNGNGITTAGRNTFVGLNAGNLTMGSTATNADQASYNTGIGFLSLSSNTTGSYNTANGYQSLRSNTTGYGNTTNGFQSLYWNTTGYYNTANGFRSLYANTTGSDNTANGYYSLFSNTTGGNNTALGFNSGRYIADGTTGRSTGNNGLYLGYNSMASADGTDNEIVIGANAIGKGSNTATYGNTSITKHIFSNGNVGIGTTDPTHRLQVAGDASFAVGTSSPSQVHYVAAPVTGTDAVNRNYVDTLIADSVSATDFWKLSGSNLYSSSTDWKVGIGTTNPGSKLTVSGINDKDSGPILNLSGSSVNQFESGRVRFTETTVAAAPFYQGAFFHYDGGGNVFNIGVHENNDALQSSDINSIRITRSNGSVNIGNGALFAQYNGNVGVGTTAPGAKFEALSGVSNNEIARFSGTLTARGLRLSSFAVGGVNEVGFNFNAPGASSNAALSFSTLGLERLRIDQSGNVGINTTDPTHKLQVAGDASFAVGTSSPSQIHYVAAPVTGTDAVNRNYVDTLIADSVSATDFWKLSGSNLYSSSTNWNVGIGTTNPDSKLIVNGSFGSVMGDIHKYYNVASYDNTPITGTMVVTLPKYGSRTMLAIKISGYDYTSNRGYWEIMIGGYNYNDHSWISTSLEYKGTPPFNQVRLANNGTNDLILLGTTSTAWSYPKVVVSEVQTGFNSTTNWGTGWSMNVVTTEPTLYNVYDLAPKNFVDVLGNFGIGTAIPSAALDIFGKTKLTSNGIIFNTDSTRWLDMTGTNVDSLRVPGDIHSTAGLLKIDGTGNSYVMGKLGVGTTSPEEVLHAKAYSAHLRLESAAGQLNSVQFNSAGVPTWQIGVRPNENNNLYFSSGVNTQSGAPFASAAKLTIQQSGNVGIGTTTPSTKLYVNGVVTATGFSGALTGTVNASNISKGIFGANTGQGTYHFGGITANGDSHYQWTGAIYRNPGDYTPQINIRQDNATTGINGFKPALTLYNQNGDLNSTIGLDFAVRETTASGNATALAGIMAIKESAGTPSAWTQGGLLFYTKNFGERIDALRILNNGNVGIGTIDPGAFKLKVDGNVAITGTLQTMTGSDFAEEFTVSSPLEAGTVVVMGDLGYKSVKACGEKFDSTVVGVVSDNPSIIAGRVDSKHKVVVAMAGVVKVKVSDANGKIKKGTMLTTSNISGYAMKADNTHPGTIIGKALEDLSGKQGEIKVLINLQ